MKSLSANSDHPNMVVFLYIQCTTTRMVLAGGSEQGYIQKLYILQKCSQRCRKDFLIGVGGGTVFKKINL